MPVEENKAKARRAIDFWGGEDYFDLLTKLSQQLDVNLFEVYKTRMRLKTGVRVKNKHTGHEGFIDRIEKSATIRNYDQIHEFPRGARIDGDPYYHLILEDGTKEGLQPKSFWQHWDVLD